ncbi:MAG: electron transfer flavoprotein subunit beta/FixA family protein [Desulfobacteraceae bacterium]|nr:electron transfer flavoprotein subunit beta/FixA family protein [Desulfobacteraceae bacterium]
MEIVVLLKQVPSTESLVEIAADGVSIKTDDIKWVMNPYDELAVEEALKIRESGEGQVTILTIGPEKAVEAMRTALAMGADKGVRIDPGDLRLDGLGTAKVLAAALKEMPYDLIIAGHRAVDDDNYQAGPAVAELLGIPNISMVIKQDISDGKIQCHRTVEGGTVVIESPLPALITTQRGLNEPRYASLPGIMKAKKKPVDVKPIADLGLDENALAGKTTIAALTPPPERKGGRVLDGDTAQDKVTALVNALRDEAKAI